MFIHIETLDGRPLINCPRCGRVEAVDQQGEEEK